MSDFVEQYIDKWVLCYRAPNRQNRNIGKIQCLFIQKETANMVKGGESKKSRHLYSYHKEEVIRIIEEKDIKEIRKNQHKLVKGFVEVIKETQKTYQEHIKKVCECTF